MDVDVVVTRNDTGSTLKAGINASADEPFGYIKFER
jgi:hypothetical protein